ncbi:MAG: sulfatase-like hydrolase/transferase [Clostridiales bacterium]|uniref:LTA synthase family protein n=1 Tax=Clostridia TaxID=186801 RepID=UPI0025D667A8|nr:sulfatase-like hydrolase/transferase [uncultured Intestinibacter sp.]MDU1201571.1 sulfatase-like hydrolase/transferase [Clostridiales bacterium]
MKKLNEIFKLDKRTIHQILLWLIGGLVLVFATEFLLRGSFEDVITLIKEKPGVVLANYLLILMLTSIFFLVKRKYMVYFISFMVILGVAITTFFLMKVRGIPLTFSDLYSIGEAMEIADKYINKTMIIIAVICLAFLIAVAVFLYKLDCDTKRFKLINFVLIFIVSIGFFSTVRSQQSKNIMQFKRWDIPASYKCNGLTYSTVESCVKYIRKKPNDYSQAKIQEIKDKVDKAEASDNRTLNNKKPNILFVQLEAFMDPTEVKGIKYSEDPIPNFRKLTQTFTHGMASAPTTGGGTVRTEFEVMTGNNIDYLTPGEIPYNTILKSKYYNSVATTLKSEGYKAHAVHNFQGNFYGRNNAYAKLGFDDFTSKEYMSNYELNEREWVKDVILTKYIEKALDSTKDSDLVYTVSVQGHSSYPTDAENYDFPIKVSGTLDQKVLNQMYYYVNQIKGTDDFIGELVDMVNKRDEDTIILFYSDHMPKLKIFEDDDFYLDKYKAPFAFYANFDIEKYDIDEIESYELSSLMFKEAGLKYGPMERFNTYMKDDPEFSKMQDLIEYDVLFGKSYYINDDEKAKKNTLKMGVEDIVINNIETKGNKMIIHGENFTTNSRVYLNDKQVDKKFIDENTLEVDKIDNLDTISIKQIGRNSVVLSSTQDFKYSDLQASK